MIEHDHAEDFSRRMIINMSFIRQASLSLSKCDRAEKDEGQNFLQIMDGWLFFGDVDRYIKTKMK